MIILINAISVKKHGGGVFQIAINFILKLTENCSDKIDFIYVVSEDLNDVFKSYTFSKFDNYYVFPTQPDFIGTYYKSRKKLMILEDTIKPNLVYSIASPSYFSFKAPEVMRFANAWITNPNKYAYSKLNPKEKIRLFLYTFNQKRLMSKRKYFITQSETVKKGILSIVKTEKDNVKVVPNVLPALFTRANVIFKNNINSKVINIATVANPSPHKNIDIIPEVLRKLRDNHGIDNVVFLITLPEKSNLLKKIQYDLNSTKMLNKIRNYGYCTQEELIELYKKCEICFMPTLLETFSATLLEAMFYNLAIVTTDFNFNKDVVGDSALYFEPLNADDAADKLALLIRDQTYREYLKSKMPEYLDKHFSFENYVNETISFLKKIALKNH